MKKYKLIEEYPNSPVLGTIIEEYQQYSTKFTLPDGSNYFNSFKLEDYAKYKQWQEIIEKEYQILSFIEKDHVISWDGNVYRYKGLRLEIVRTEQYLETILDKIKITSIKRLSDGEVFTVGDKITGTAAIAENPSLGPGYVKITGFKSNKNNTFDIEINTGVVCDYRHQYKDFEWAFLNIKKYKQPLFTTEDGIEIFEGDQYTYVRSDYSYKTVVATKNDGSSKLSSHYLGDFSTKEVAEEYILMNKPCLSINDISKITFEVWDEKKKTLIELKKLVKSKL